MTGADFLIPISHFCESWTLRRVICICPFHIVPSLHEMYRTVVLFFIRLVCAGILVSGNGAPPCNTWHLTDVRRASHLCEFNVNLCITVSISLWHFWNNPTYLPCPGETAELCLPWLMNGRISKKFYVYFLMKL